MSTDLLQGPSSPWPRPQKSFSERWAPLYLVTLVLVVIGGLIIQSNPDSVVGGSFMLGGFGLLAFPVGAWAWRLGKGIRQEIDIALGPLPPVEALRHPDGTPITAEEQALLQYQMAQRQVQARQGLALLGGLWWFLRHR